MGKQLRFRSQSEFTRRQGMRWEIWGGILAEILADFGRVLLQMASDTEGAPIPG